MKRTTMYAIALITFAGHAAASGGIDRSQLDFRVEIRGECSYNPVRESGLLGTVLGQTLIEAGVGFASAMLEQAAADNTRVLSATAPSSMYMRVGESLAFKPQCIRYWHGRTAESDDTDTSKWPGALGFTPEEAEGIVVTWKDIGLTEPPYAYGEIAVMPNAAGTAVHLQPVVFFYRPHSDSLSWFRHDPSLAIGVDLVGVAGTVVSTAVMSHGERVSGPVLLVGDALRGKTSGWMAIPPRPEKKDDWANTVGDTTVKVSFTTVQKGSALVKAMADAVKAKKADISAAATAQLPAKKAEAEATAAAAATAAKDAAMAAVYDAEIEVAKAEKALVADPTSAELKLKLDKAKHQADLKRKAAGLAPKYNVVPA